MLLRSVYRSWLKLLKVRLILMLNLKFLMRIILCGSYLASVWPFPFSRGEHQAASFLTI
nr:hypothetical protein Iba_chr14aCG11850 [Ipomoea batatas]GMD87524.1 hypothetical protein Iba_chr14bCG16590 [Ipomoea batatas]GMD92512.1 hypothetical protein Iba_chr14eCG9840 [Ipomoea batatas]